MPRKHPIEHARAFMIKNCNFRLFPVQQRPVSKDFGGFLGGASIWLGHNVRITLQPCLLFSGGGGVQALLIPFLLGPCRLCLVTSYTELT